MYYNIARPLHTNITNEKYNRINIEQYLGTNKIIERIIPYLNRNSNKSF